MCYTHAGIPEWCVFHAILEPALPDGLKLPKLVFLENWIERKMLVITLAYTILLVLRSFLMFKISASLNCSLRKLGVTDSVTCHSLLFFSYQHLLAGNPVGVSFIIEQG